MVFAGRSEYFSKAPSVGSYTELNLDDKLCFERETKFGPYGLGHGSLRNRTKYWDSVDWGYLQQQCIAKNDARFTEGPRNFSIGAVNKIDKFEPHPRTALLIRSWSGKNYTENDKQNLRSMVTELSLRTGGEYQVFLLVQIKNNSIPIYTDETARNLTIQKYVPKEFWNMTVVWNVHSIKKTYPKTPGETHNGKYKRCLISLGILKFGTILNPCTSQFIELSSFQCRFSRKSTRNSSTFGIGN